MAVTNEAIFSEKLDSILAAVSSVESSLLEVKQLLEESHLSPLDKAKGQSSIALTLVALTQRMCILFCSATIFLLIINRFVSIDR